MIGSSLGFVETLLGASYNISLMSVLTPMYDPRAPTLAVVEERKTLCKEEELTEMREDTEKKGEHIYPVMSPAQFSKNLIQFSTV